MELMKEWGVGLVMGLAFVLTIGPVRHFRNSRRLVSDWGLIPSDHLFCGAVRGRGGVSKKELTALTPL